MMFQWSRRLPAFRPVLAKIPVIGARLFRAPNLIRYAAIRARRAGKLEEDAFYRRHICRISPRDAGAWLQYGHSLKELGFFALARDTYERALSISPANPDVLLHLAHLAKLAGDFDTAALRFDQARNASHPMLDQIDWEVALLRQIGNSVIFAERKPDSIPEGLHVYLSSTSGRLSDSSIEGLSALGRADYSYGFVMRGFVDALEALEIDYTVLPSPESVTDIRERSNSAINIHLAIYPPERMRLLKGAYNIGCIAWEFDRLRTSSEIASYHAFQNQSRMLDLCDEIWVLSEHGADAVRKSVSKPIRAIPSPVLSHDARSGRQMPPARMRIEALATKLRRCEWQPLAILPRIQGVMNDGATARETTLPEILAAIAPKSTPLVFLTILNVHDFRKQLKPMLQAFVEFAQHEPRALLLIKMTSPDRGKMPINSFIMMDQIIDAGELPRPLVSDRVWITDRNLTREELNVLFDISAFYICTSYAEGQNLPIIEAMTRGVVPVSVDHTAMAEYISDTTAVVIPSSKRPFDPRLASRYGMYGISTNFVEATEVRDGLRRARGLTDAKYGELSNAAADVVRERFGIERFAAAFAFVKAAAQENAVG